MLEQVLQEPRRLQFKELDADWERLVTLQVRRILDLELPEDLCRSCFARSSQTYVLENGRLTAARPGIRGTSLSSLEAYERFGGSALEEVAEFGSCRVGGATSG